MPSPRFSRLPPERRASILDAARRHFAREGAEAASYNRIIAEAGISKTSAYLYFDGKDDLVAEVRRELAARLAAVIGVWRPASSPRQLWAQLRATSDALHRHLLAHPDDLALLGQAPTVTAESEIINDTSTNAWFAALLDDGLALGMIRADLPRPLLLAATRALFRVADEYVLVGLVQGQPVDPAPVWELLRGLWTKPARAASRAPRTVKR